MAEQFSLLRFGDPERTVDVDVPALWRDGQVWDDSALMSTTMRIKGIFKEEYFSDPSGFASIGKSSPAIQLPTALIPNAEEDAEIVVHRETFDVDGVKSTVATSYITALPKRSNNGITTIELIEAPSV